MSFMQIRPSVRIKIPKQTNKQNTKTKQTKKKSHRKRKEVNSLSREKLLYQRPGNEYSQ